MNVSHFMIKRAGFFTVFPGVAGPMVGGFLGNTLAPRLRMSPNVGGMIGAITGGTAGKLLGEHYENTEKVIPQGIPPGAPYALDASSAYIPTWALQGAQLLQPVMKQGSEHESPTDMVIGEIPFANAVQDWRKGTPHIPEGGPIAGARAFGGMTMGGVPGGLLGTGAAKGVEHLVGHSVRVPGINMSLSDLLGSIGGAIGAAKGLRYMQS